MTRARARVVGIVVAAVAMGGLGVEPMTAAPEVVQAPAAEAASAARQGNRRSYRATRRIVDPQSQQARMPTAREVEEMVVHLSAMTRRPETLQQTTSPSGGVMVDLNGGFAGVMLARPNEDGTLEMLCVFTFEEGAEFLGLVEVIE